MKGLPDSAAVVKSWRGQFGLSQQELADRMRERDFLQIHATTISRIESGERPLRLDEAYAIADCFGASIVEVFGLGRGIPFDPNVAAQRRVDKERVLRPAREAIKMIRESIEQMETLG